MVDKIIWALLVIGRVKAWSNGTVRLMFFLFIRVGLLPLIMSWKKTQWMWKPNFEGNALREL